MTREEAKSILEEERDVYIPKWIKDIKLDFFDRRWVNALELAIKALEQEPCDDVISRENTLKAVIEQLGIRNEDYLLPAEATLYKVVKNMPPVTPQPKTGQWIPVSERMPEDGQIVLFCDIDNDIMVGYHIKGRPYTHFSQVGTFDDMKNVRAWMPLPKPYEP